MVTLFILLLIAGILLMVLAGACAILLDPIIAILAVFGIYKLVKLCFGKRKKK